MNKFRIGTVVKLNANYDVGNRDTATTKWPKTGAIGTVKAVGRVFYHVTFADFPTGDGNTWPVMRSEIDKAVKGKGI